MRTGDRIDVVMDCVIEEIAGHQIGRVFIRLVDAPPSEGGKPPPPPLPDANRNVVQRWMGITDNQTAFAAFAFDLGPAQPPTSTT